jgi:hypothetical protein
MKARQSKQESAPRRPAVNPPMPDQTIEEINGEFARIRSKLENYAAHLRALDRRRLNGIGIKTEGFISTAYHYAALNPDFLPHYLPLDKFGEDHAYFQGFKTLLESVEQLREMIWNITIQSGDVVYTDSLEFYAMAREAAKRRIDPAEAIYNELKPFFKRRRKNTDKPTVKKTLSHANALLHGDRDGEIVIKNLSPKVTGGAHEVIDVIENRD